MPKIPAGMAVAALLLALLVTGCTPASPDPQVTAAAEPPTEAVSEAPPTDIPTALPPTEAPSPVLPTNTPAPTPLPSSDNCIACHTSPETLQALARDEEKVVSEEIEGEG